MAHSNLELGISTVTLTFTVSLLHAFLLFNFLNVAQNHQNWRVRNLDFMFNVMGYITVIRYPMIHHQLYIKIENHDQELKSSCYLYTNRIVTVQKIVLFLSC